MAIEQQLKEQAELELDVTYPLACSSGFHKPRSKGLNIKNQLKLFLFLWSPTFFKTR